MASMRNEQQEHISGLEEILRKLKSQYDQFFAGSRHLPPSEERKRFDRAMRELAKGRIRDNAVRFRYNNLVNKWTMYQELWNRRTREKEEGPLQYQRRVEALERAAETLAARAEESREADPRVTTGEGQSYVKVTDSSNGAEIEALHQEIVRVSAETGQKAASLGQVSTMIDTQMSRLRERYGDRAIGFRVEVVEGKIKLKARPL
jgi:hypothetical protein